MPALRRAARRHAAIAILLLATVAPPAPARAITPNRSIAVAFLAEPRTGRRALWLGGAAWLEGPWSVTASLGWWSAGRTGDRAADGRWPAGPVPAVGLRWAPDWSGWRPEAALELGARWGGAPSRRAAMEVAARGGVEWLASRTAGLGLWAGGRCGDGTTATAEGGAALRLYF